MIIAAAQIKPITGDIEQNVQKHITFINLAVAQKADLILFPELSLTGYEPKLAESLAVDSADKRFDIFQEISNLHAVTIAVGVPLKKDTKVLIGMLVFQPGLPLKTYAKQLLHADELPYFSRGTEQLFLKLENKTLAPAICYESLQPEHAENASGKGAEIYLASVAKPAQGLAKAYAHYPTIARKHNMTVLMADCVGFCDNFDSVGTSSVWNNKGELVRQMDEKREGVLVYDTTTIQTTSLYL